MSKPQAQTLLERYWDECNNRAQFESIREVCADPITRHDPGKTQTLSHDEQIARVRFGVEEMGVWIEVGIRQFALDGVDLGPRRHCGDDADQRRLCRRGRKLDGPGRTRGG